MLVLTSQPAHAKAPSLSKDGAQKIVEDYLVDRAARVTQAGGARTGGPLTDVPTTAALRERFVADAQRLDQLRVRNLTTPSRGHTRAQVDVTIDSLTQTGNDRVELRATERGKLYFGHGDPAAPQFEGYRLRHSLTLVNDKGLWTLADDAPELASGPPPPPYVGYRASVSADTTDSSTPILPGKIPAAKVAPAGGAPASAGQVDKLRRVESSVGIMYDYDAMWNYAAAYWDNYNPAYRSFPNDCTSFISQIMEAGGWQYDTGPYWLNNNWWYNSLNQTHTWAGAHNWGLFAQVYSQRTVPLQYVNQLLPTDVLQVDWDHPDEVPGELEGNIDHTMFVDRIMGPAGNATEIYLTYHSNDRWDVPFFGELLVDPRDVWYAHRT